MMFAKGTNQMKNTVNVVLHLKIEQRYVNYKNFDYIYRLKSNNSHYYAIRQGLLLI